MIEKFLIRFCASEVRIMITRLHERPDDFDYGSRWRDLVEAREGFTWVERKVLATEWAKFKKGQKRRELLNLITKEVLDPTPTDKWGLTATQRHIYNTTQNAGLQNAYTDPRVLYGNYK